MTLPAWAQETVLINEVIIEPTQSVELINTSSELIDISKWHIDDSGGTTYFTLPENTYIYPSSCIVISGDFNLNKTSTDSIRLFNSTHPPTELEAELINAFTYSKSPGIGISFQRMPDNSNTWESKDHSLGLNNDTKQSCIVLPTVTVTPTHTPQPEHTQTPTLTPVDDTTTTPSPTLTITPSADLTTENIYISEVMVYPDSGSEWIELYNDNDYLVELVDWFIDDKENAGANPKKISITIDPKKYAVYDIAISIFNNDGDSARILSSEEQLIDEIQYSESIKGQTIGRTSFNNQTVCTQNPSKNSVNNSCFEITITPTATPTVTKTPTPIKMITPTIPKLFEIYAENDNPNVIASKNTSNSSYFSHFNKTNLSQPDSSKILGTNTEKISNLKVKKIRDTSIFASFSYSFLAILSLALKIKKSLLA